MADAPVERPKVKRGFAALSPEKRREIASMGGKSHPADNRTFSKHRALAAEAGARNRDRTQE